MKTPEITANYSLLKKKRTQLRRLRSQARLRRSMDCLCCFTVQASASAEEASKMVELLGLSPDVAEALTECPIKEVLIR